LKKLTIADCVLANIEKCYQNLISEPNQSLIDLMLLAVMKRQIQELRSAPMTETH
jgi:hypothetical protein